MKAGDLLGVLECVPLDKEACCTVTSETLQHINLVETWLSPSHMWKMRHTYHDCLLPRYHGLGCQQQALPVPKRSFLKRWLLPTLSISLQAAVLVTLSCCDYTPWPRQLTEKKNYLGYGYRGSVHDGRRGVTAGSQAGSRENTSSNINVKQTESTGSGVYYGFQEEQNII